MQRTRDITSPMPPIFTKTCRLNLPVGSNVPKRLDSLCIAITSSNRQCKWNTRVGLVNQKCDHGHHSCMSKRQISERQQTSMHPTAVHSIGSAGAGGLRILLVPTDVCKHARVGGRIAAVANHVGRLSQEQTVQPGGCLCHPRKCLHARTTG